MKFKRTLPGHVLACLAATAVAALLAVVPCVAQTSPSATKTGQAGAAQGGAAQPKPVPKIEETPVGPQSAPPAEAKNPVSDEYKKFPELPAEIKLLASRLITIQFPPPRTESKILPLLPESTVGYIATSNFGDPIHQAVVMFQQQLEARPALKDWWLRGSLAKDGPKIIDALDKVSQALQFVGDEVVVAGGLAGGWKDNKATIVAIAQAKQPGLKEFLDQVIASAKPNTPPRVMDEQELAAATGKPTEGGVLVRPDYVVAGSDLATLRAFNAHLNAGDKGEFVSGGFAQRLKQSYDSGATLVAGFDLHRILGMAPANTGLNGAGFQNSGFADVKYLIWKRGMVADKTVSQSELSFMGPRHGAAAWLAKPAPMGSLDFVSPRALMVVTLMLTSPAQIFDDSKTMADAMHSTMFQTLAPLEQALKVSLRDDLLANLGGEITLELDDLAPEAKWRVLLRVTDTDHVQQTLAKLLATAPFKAEQFDENGVTYYVMSIPVGNGRIVEVAHAFVDGYLIVASGRSSAADAVRAHRNGGSMAKSEKFLAVLPPGRGLEASTLFYQDPAAFASLGAMRQPELLAGLEQVRGKAVSASLGYADETAIRGESNSSGVEAGVVLAVAALAIPNLLRARVAANEASAVGSLRTVNTAQVTYSAIYAKRGFAPNLASLGPDPKVSGAPSPQHAALVGEELGAATCTGATWCQKSGYHFRVTGVCRLQNCTEYVVVAIPIEVSQTGNRNFCSTSDGVIRWKIGKLVNEALTVAECKKWEPLQ